MTDTLTSANYFQRHDGCHSLCRVARGLVSDGERHDPRCAVVRDMAPSARIDIARQAEQARRDQAETTDDARCTIGRANTSAPAATVTYVTSGRSDYSDARSTCCGDSEHRPAGGSGPWFCMSCGKTRLDNPPARRR